MGCESSSAVAVPQNESDHINNQMSPAIQTKNACDKNEANDIYEGDFQKAQNLQKNKKYDEAIKLYLSIKDEKHMSQICAGVGNCYRLTNSYEQSIQWSLKSFSLKNNELACNSLAIIYRIKKDYQTAKEWCLKGKQINPNYAYIYITLGSIYNLLNEKDNAIANYQKAIQIDTKSQMAYRRFSQFYSQNKEYQKALQLLHKLVEFSPNNQEAYFDIALIYKNKLNNQDEAMKYLKKAIDKNPQYSVAYNTIGNICNDRKQYAESESYFKKSIQINPEYVYPHNGLGNSLYARKMYKQSIQSYLRAIKIDPSYSTPYSGIGDAYKQIKDFKKSIQMYNKSIELNSMCGDPYNGLGNVYREKGENLQSIKWYKKSIQVNPTNQHPYNGIGNSLKDLKQFDEAITYYKKSIQINPKYNYPYNGIGNVYNQKGDLVESQEWYKKCLEIDPTYDKPYNNLGNLYFHNNRHEDAKKHYVKALQVNPKCDAAYNGLGLCLVAQQKYEQAIKYYSKGIQVNPNYSLICINYAICLIKIQNYPQAFKFLKKAKYIIDNAETDVFGGCRAFVTNQLKCFEDQMADWQFKSKKGFLDPKDKQRIQKLRQDFEAKIKLIFKTNNDGNSKLDPKNLNNNFLHVLAVIYEDKFKLDKSTDLAKIIFELFKENTNNFNIIAYIFCRFFWNQKNQKNQRIKNIEKKLEIKIDQLTDIYPPSSSNATNNTTINLKKDIPQKRINLFKQVEYFEDYRFLVKEIQGIHQISKKVLPKFKEFIYQICSDYKGYHSKANLKLPENESERFRVYIRIMEKMFREIKSKKAIIIDNIQKIINQKKQKDMAAVISYLIDAWSEQINRILKQRINDKEPTSCEITDFVRGKAMFKSVEDIVIAANSVIDKSSEAGFQITEIDNRLGKETKDLVFKILIDGIVCQFQMALENDSNQYNFSHSFYQIRRSPMGCVFGSFLFLSKFQTLSFFNEAKEIYEYFKDKKLNDTDLSYMKGAQYLTESMDQQT